MPWWSWSLIVAAGVGVVSFLLGLLLEKAKVIWSPSGLSLLCTSFAWTVTFIAKIPIVG